MDNQMFVCPPTRKRKWVWGEAGKGGSDPPVRTTHAILTLPQGGGFESLLPSGSAGVAAPFPDFSAPAFRFTSLLFRFLPLLLVCTDSRSPRLRMAFWWPLLVLALAYGFCRFLLMLIPPSVPSIEVDASDGMYCSFLLSVSFFSFFFCLCSLFWWSAFLWSFAYSVRSFSQCWTICSGPKRIVIFTWVSLLLSLSCCANCDLLLF